ncbi:MAG TPA: hypothetical protein VLA34_02130 [Candidatus Krumholzibacterium sp.]|nr:hypothetical protein [Candidatus Krumholzibacterium sp.]
MRTSSSLMVVAVPLLLALAAAAGCGGDSGGKDSDQDFRVPDSLLAPLEGFGITVDEYHPVKGGVIANRDIAIHYPASGIAEYISTNTFTHAYNGYKAVVKAIGRPAEGQIVVIGANDMDEYKYLTRKDWWYYGYIQGDTLYFEPFNVMLKRYDPITRRTLLEIGLAQKFGQMALNTLSGGRLPIWLKESIASFVANEKPVLEVQAIEFKAEMVGFDPTLEEIEAYLTEAEDRGATRVAYYISHLMLENLFASFTLDEIVSFAKRLGEGQSLDQASGEIFGMDYSALVEKARLKRDFTSYLDNVKRPDPRKDE